MLDHNTILNKSPNNLTDTNQDYAEVLDKYEIPYTAVDFYYQVGTVPDISGWILHIAVVKTQVVPLLETVLPILVAEKVAFKLIQNKEAVQAAVDGSIGINRIGKVLTVYPINNKHALHLAKQLIRVTTSFKCPPVFTDRHLGGIVYTRYGSFQPHYGENPAGRRFRFMTDDSGKMVPDEYQVPFEPPSGVNWPFGEITSVETPVATSLLNGKYQPLQLLSDNPKGAVMIASIPDANGATCVIKQGIAGMWHDEGGQDMVDRLKWQYELHRQLDSVVTLPKALDYFEYEENGYLVLEHINGLNLHQYITVVNREWNSWAALSVDIKECLLDILIKIVEMIEKLHQAGFVHRDITPINFMVTDDGQIHMMDLEMAYSYLKQYPAPPFTFGTWGFVAPEGLDNASPAPEEDVYGVGATLLNVLTGLSPLMFNTKDRQALRRSIFFVLQDDWLTETIAVCLRPLPEERPALAWVIDRLRRSRQQLRTVSFHKIKQGYLNGQHLDIDRLINAGIAGLVQPPTAIRKDVWQTVSSNAGKQAVFTTTAEYYGGVAGIINVLADAKAAGYNIDPCRTAIERSWEFVEQRFFSDHINMRCGLMGGAGGIGLALCKAMQQGMIPRTKEHQQEFWNCLIVPITESDLAASLAGQGEVILECMQQLSDADLREYLEWVANAIIARKGNDGLWHSNVGEQANPELLGIYMDALVIIFLLKYGTAYSQEEALQNGISALDVLIPKIKTWERNVEEYGYLQCTNFPHFQEAINTGAMACMYGFSRTGENRYKQIAESLLQLHPPQQTCNNLSLASGFSGVGTLYIEAFRLLEDSRWMERAQWIYGLMLNLCQHTESKDGVYWISDSHPTPIAGLMDGNAGIIQFLIKKKVNEIAKY